MKIISLALTIAAANAFVPAATNHRAAVPSVTEQSTTSLGPGFLKDLGFEKPSWLPDFGGKKEEPVAVAETEEGEGEEAEEATEDEAEVAP